MKSTAKITASSLLIAFFGVAMNVAVVNVAEAAPAKKTQAKKAKAAKLKAKSAAVPAPKSEKWPSPGALIQSRTQRALTILMSRPIRPAPRDGHQIEIESDADKTQWIKAVYEKNLVDSSWATEMLADKRLMAEVIERELGEDARMFFPKTMGLRELLVKHKLVNMKGEIVADEERFDQVLHDEFDAGFVVKPAVGIAPYETAKGLFAGQNEFVAELLSPKSSLYQPAHFRKPVKSHILGTVASGEAVVIQESVVGTADSHKALKNRQYENVVIHTYEGKVVEDSVPARWVRSSRLKKEEISRAEAFVAAFLNRIPVTLLNRQAWGVDVAVMDNGEMRILDIQTNRGKNWAWSSYLDQPRVIGAYTRHFEAGYGVRFKGWSGTLLRHDFANYFPYWERRIEKARPGWHKLKAYLPPLP
jgi:hypothetical protein